MEQDRISYSFGMKVNLGNYQSADFHVSLSSDVKPGETLVSAFNRVKLEVETYAELTFHQIKNSNQGLTNEQTTSQPDIESTDTKNVSAPVEVKADPQSIPERITSIKTLKNQIKAAYGVLSEQKKITQAEFKQKFLGNKKTDDLSELEVTKAIVGLREQFPELKL